MSTKKNDYSKLTNKVIDKLPIAITKKSLISLLEKNNISLDKFTSKGRFYKHRFIAFMKYWVDKQKEIGNLSYEFEQMKKLYSNIQKKNKSYVDKAEKLGIKLPQNKTFTVSALIYRRIIHEDDDDYNEYYEKYKNDGTRYVMGSDGYLYTNSFGVKHFNVNNSSIRNFNKRTYDFDDDWKQLIKILSYDAEFMELYENHETYFNLIIIKHVSSGHIVKKTIKDALFESIKLHSDKEGGLYHQYIDYGINKNAKNFGDLFELKIEPYTKDNYKNNSCYINALVDTFHNAFSKNKNYKFNATYDDFIDLFDFDKKKIDENNIGLTINESIKFFEKFNIGLCVFGVFGVIKVFIPEKFNTHINPNKLYMVVSNGHCYQINDKFDRFVQKVKYVWNPDAQLNEDLTGYIPSNKYIVGKKNDNVNHDVQYINDINDLYENIKNTDDDEKTFRKYICDDGLLNILEDMMYSGKGYIPDINFSGGKIRSLKIKIGGVLGTIEGSTDNEDNEQNVCLSPNVYKLYHEQNDKFKNALLCEDHMSYYNPINIKIEKEFKMCPMTGYFDNDDICNDKYNGLDSRKAYTSDLYDMEYYPVYSYFDVWKVYDDHKIEDYNQYIIRCDDKTLLSNIVFPFTYTRCTGYLLNRIEKLKYQILYFKRPSKLIESNAKQIINELYDIKFDDNEKCNEKCKKDIVNISIGLLGKKYNKRTVCKAFKDIDEASYYSCKYGGNIYDLSNQKEENEDEVFEHVNNKNIFILEKKYKTELINGFVPIREMVYDIRTLKNYKTCVKLIKNDIKIYGILTDCVIFHKDDTEKVKELFDLSNKIGCYKIEHNKELKGDLIKRKDNNSPDANDFKIKVNVHKINNERDMKEINKVFEKHNTVILGELPGVGKTYACKNSNYENKLFVCPTNKLCHMLRKDGHESITVHMLLGLGCNDQQNKKMKEIDISKYDCIIFDEIYLNTPNILSKIGLFMQNNKDKRFLATGDCNQLEPIGFDMYNNISKEERNNYLDHCVSILFPNMIKLRECKRLKNKEDIEKMRQMKKEILDDKINIIDTLKKYGFRIVNNMKDVKTVNNVAYYKKQCEIVNNHVIENLVKPDKCVIINGVKYWKGMTLICDKRFNLAGIKCHTNYEYELKKINSNKFTLYESIEDKTFELDIKFIDNFRYSFCNTVHSIQGLTFIEDYTIFDVDSPRASRNWIYTAITRTDDISKITIFQSSKKTVENREYSMLVHYFLSRIEDHKKADKKANREFNKKDYVDYNWVSKKFKERNTCSLCNVPFETEIKNCSVKSNISIDRIDNKKPHNKNNCRLICRECNKKSSNKRRD